MDFKGTQGKWIFNDIDFKIKGSGDIEGLTVIANVSPKMDYSRGKTTQSYNALLISKAPEMLKMLKNILYSVENSNIESDVISIQDLEELIKEATQL